MPFPPFEKSSPMILDWLMGLENKCCWLRELAMFCVFHAGGFGLRFLSFDDESLSNGFAVNWNRVRFACNLVCLWAFLAGFLLLVVWSLAGVFFTRLKPELGLPDRGLIFT